MSIKKKYLRIDVEDSDGLGYLDLKEIDTNLSEIEYITFLRKLMFRYPKEKK